MRDVNGSRDGQSSGFDRPDNAFIQLGSTLTNCVFIIGQYVLGFLFDYILFRFIPFY